MIGGMEFRPKVFIVILNKDGKECLPACLRSVFSLSYVNFEVVVVDNASRDGSIEDARRDFSRAHFILNRENVGFAAGMNVGIRYALSKGAEYIWLLNNDTTVDRNSLSALIEAAEESGDALLSPVIRDTSGNIWFSGGTIEYLRMRAIHTDTVRPDGNDAVYETGYLSGCALLLSRKAVETVGIFDDGYFLYYEDVDYSVRSAKRDFRLLVVPKASVIHAERSGENPEKPYWLVRSGLRFFALHTPLHLRPLTFLYLLARRTKNLLDIRRGSEQASLVASAYRDYDSDRKSS